MADDLLNRAITIATKALEGIQDENGNPYLEHAFRVMNQMDTEEEKIVAVLHDVLEDTQTSMGELKEAGFSGRVLQALEELTKRKDMTYYEYIEDIRSGELASKVKIAEVKDNKDIFRVRKLSFRTYSLEERAEKTIKYLSESP